MRFILGMGVMLLPLVVLAVGAFLSVQSVIGAFDEVLHEASDEIGQVVRLHFLMRKERMVVHDHFIHGISELDEPQRFTTLSDEVDKAFRSSVPGPFRLEEEQVLVRSAQGEWQQTRAIGEVILSTPRPVTNPTAMENLYRFDAHLDKALDFLEQVHNLAQREMSNYFALVRGVRQRALFIIATVFLLGLATAVLMGTALARSVLNPLRSLEEGTTRFGAGDLSHRVPAATPDELGELGEAFNAMAENLAKSQKALEELSTLDGLTGLYNYREFHRRLTDEMQRSLRYGHPFSLLILDIDGFKVVNDTHGHLAGDEALRGLAGLIRQEVRPADEVARYGGEEFAILLPETPSSGAFAMGERIRDIVAARPIPIALGQTVGLTVSIGVATYPHDAESEETLIAAADQALYAAKNAGRNRVCQWARPSGTLQD
jgi:diguanylate cyclase (GGDEF)-like protein